jgi:ABC-type transport system substrate-binding protein
LIQAWLAQAGVKVNILQKADNPSENTALQNGQDNMFLNGWGCGDPDCLYSWFDPKQIGPGGSNFFHTNDPTLMKFLTQGREASSSKAAAAAYDRAVQWINSEAYAVPLYDFISAYALRSRVHGFRQSALGDQIWQDLWVS